MYNERRRENPSYTIPSFYLALELTLGWLVLSFAEFTTQISEWSMLSSLVLSIWALYAFNKYINILMRQKEHHINNFR